MRSTIDEFDLEILGRFRLARVCESAARALLGWSNGARAVDLWRTKPSTHEMLEMQARGRRCVSLLGDVDANARDDEGLEFALHDLRHVEKFFDPEHHLGQLGFFRCVLDALSTDAWRSLDGRLDDEWRKDFEQVVADMNGSAVFLFAALKMRLRMASRRRLARRLGHPPPACGVLNEREERAYAEDLDELLDALALTGDRARDARVISTKRDAHEAALGLLRHFEHYPRPSERPCARAAGF